MGLTVRRGEFCKQYQLKFSLKDAALIEAEAKRRCMPVGQLLAEWVESDIEFLRMSPPPQDEWELPAKQKRVQKSVEFVPEVRKDVKFPRQPRSDS